MGKQPTNRRGSFVLQMARSAQAKTHQTEKQDGLGTTREVATRITSRGAGPQDGHFEFRNREARRPKGMTLDGHGPRRARAPTGTGPDGHEPGRARRARPEGDRRRALHPSTAAPHNKKKGEVTGAIIRKKLFRIFDTKKGAKMGLGQLLRGIPVAVDYWRRASSAKAYFLSHVHAGS